MNKRVFLVTLGVCGSFMLAGCSDADNSESVMSSPETYAVDSFSDMQGSPAPGWRLGTLRVEIGLINAGQGQTFEADQQLDISTEINFVVNAHSEWRVWLPEDFRTLLPDYNQSVLQAQELLETDVFVYAGDEAEVPVQGELKLESVLISRSPDYSLTRQLTALGGLNRLELYQLRPSLHGEGFSARVQLAYQPQGMERITQNAGGHTQTSSSPCCEAGSLRFWLHPVPDREVFERMDYGQGTGESYLDNYNQEMREGLFQQLQEAQHDPLLRQTLQPGMAATIEPHRLILSYEASGDQVPMSDLLALTVPKDDFRLRLNITLEHDER